MKGGLIFFLFCVQYSQAIIYHLNDTEYNEMPPLFFLEPYESCLLARGGAGVYCTASLELLPPDQPSQLFSTIIEYSARTTTHFNHSRLSRGICLTETCTDYYPGETADRRLALEACLNDTFYKQYQLKVQVTDSSCHTKHDKTTTDAADVLVAVGLAVLVALNLVGTVWDHYYPSEKESLWSCFSITRNWRKLVASSASTGSRSERLQGLYGLRCMLMVFVIQAHSMLPLFQSIENSHFMEKSYNEERYQTLSFFGLLVQGFFVMSGMLLTFNLQLEQEKSDSSWQTVRKSILHRWIRLIAPYAVVVALTATWLRQWTSLDAWHGSVGVGPLWHSIAMTEVEDCRRYWWQNLMFLNNYVSESSICALHCWYLAADFQLYILGVCACALVSGRRRALVLLVLFAAGVLGSAAHTALQDLDGVMMITPETARTNFVSNPTFTHTYTRGHTNVASFVLGLGLGLLVYRWLTTERQFQLRPVHRWLLLTSVPGVFGMIWLCCVFYSEGPRASLTTRVLVGALMKPVVGGFFALLIIGMVFRLENIYRRFLEWPGWTVPATLSYCTYLVHLPLIKIISGTKTNTSHASFLHLLELMVSSIALSLFIALPLYLLVEAPMRPLIKLLDKRSPRGARGARGAKEARGARGARGTNGDKLDDNNSSQTKKHLDVNGKIASENHMNRSKGD
ncbi:hypothetical protein O0L34_g13550 [Tuta absoluta]|nr:hypothetical protein O0L34_g13550 [Tuta absoluta]